MKFLNTFLPEACAIINSRPLTAIPTDSDSPFILTPSILLTHKTDEVDERICNTDAKG